MLHLTTRLPHFAAITILAVVALAATTSLAASAFLSAQPGYAVEDWETNMYFTSHDARGTEIASYDSTVGLEIRDLANGGTVVADLGCSPVGYDAWNSFTTFDPSGNSVWVGFTNWGNDDDRIYQVNRSTGVWTLRANLTGNWDMEFFGNTAYVAANPGAPEWEAEAAIYRLDKSGSNNHELVANLGGYTAGLDFDSLGNLYYLHDTSTSLIRFAAADVAAASSGNPLTPADATTLASLPAGGYDVEVDSADHVLFNVNAATGLVAMWNGIEGAGQHYVTLATEPGAGDKWLTNLSAVGDITQFEGGMVYSTDYFFTGAAEIRLAWRPGDLNGDDFVGAGDLDIVRAHWGQDVTPGDFLSGDASRDGHVGAADLDIVRAHWGQGTPLPPGSVPEPTMPTLVLLGALGLLARRRLVR